MTDTSYSPRLRTAVVFCGAGTAGAYQAGVLRALTEAGVKVDVFAAHGAGVVTALAGAIDGGARLWEPDGPWMAPRIQHAYRWRRGLRAAGWALVAGAAVLAAPLAVLVFATVVYALSLLAGLVHAPGAAAWLVGAYGRSTAVLFAPPVLPVIVPGLLALVGLVVLGVLVISAVSAWRADRSRRRLSGAFWWRLVGAPLDSDEPAGVFVDVLWRLVRGASNQPRPSSADIGRRYVETLTDNLGQPGFRELVIGVHDLDSRRDLVAGVVAADAKTGFEARRKGPGPREAETVYLTGVTRELLIDLLTSAQRQPAVSAPHLLQFPAESYWRGELHRASDRPELAVRLIDEIAGIGVEQAVLVGAAPSPAGPHAMRARPIGLRGRIGEVARSVESAAFDDAWAEAGRRFSGVFVIRPDHNPIGPFDFAGVYDEASDRRRTVAELMQQGYDDAYRQFIEPVVASGEKIEPI